ncbi:MAG: SAM-dependent methyltransferase [Bryobacteraceae bacterium]|nr:SAM-dependent methyltransferase [Bryobacteraceae bacterium]
MSGSRNALAEKLAARIEREGPILFSEFMEAALYDPAHGYYSAARRAQAEPTGIAGDYFTATQLQPVFGRLMRAAAEEMRARLGLPETCTLADWGAGRALMAEAFSGFRYIAVEAHTPLPKPFEGIVFANELFDALPVDVVCGGRKGMRLQRVAWSEGRFVRVDGEPPEGEWKEYAERLARAFGELDDWEIELPVRMRAVLGAIHASLRRGALLVIDYGYTEREIVRFPRGTLMSYRRHQASEDVLRDPGGRDITAHVPFTHLMECAAAQGWKAAPLESLAALLLRAGERDSFASALAAEREEEAQRLRLQLKTLLFGMGETFRCLRLEKEG